MFLESLFNNGLGPKSVKLGLGFILQCLFKCYLYSYGEQMMINKKMFAWRHNCSLFLGGETLPKPHC
jgi:hypothetical protein